eukprot:m.83503 g.83503  ORF g.83503 m.83503 type:complete len:80 (+) comp14347_c0_seq1:2109-2348(+)
MVVPPFTTLFAHPPWKFLGDERPVLWSMFVDEFSHFFVLLFRPGTLDDWRMTLARRLHRFSGVAPFDLTEKESAIRFTE